MNKLLVFGADFTAAIPEMLALVGFAGVFGIIVVWRFHTSTVEGDGGLDSLFSYPIAQRGLESPTGRLRD